MNYEQRQEFENLLTSYLMDNPDEAKLIIKIFIDTAILTKWSCEDMILLLNNCRGEFDCRLTLKQYDSSGIDCVLKEIDLWLDDTDIQLRNSLDG